jgi:CRISPR-associated protein Cmr6
VFGEGTNGWDQPTIDVLFGKETESGDTETERTRGALIFWDVFPKCHKLAVDIMNPHYGEYYQGKTTPHDSGQPIPIFFLIVPANSGFTFHVQCNHSRLPADWPEKRWRELLKAAFAHAFDWLGFGAKTTVGYGGMRHDADAQQRYLEELKQRKAAAAEAALSLEQKVLAELRRWFDEDRAAKRKEPGGRLANRLNELLKEGLPWPAAEREDLAKLAETIYGYLDWGSGKKKQERKAKIQQLRQGSI